MNRDRRALRSAVGLVAGLVVLLLQPAAAAAHTEALASSNPAAGSVVRSLDTVELHFVDTIQAGSATFTLRAGDGTDVGLPAPAYAKNDSVATFHLDNPAPDGRYRIGYQVIFTDGDPAVGVVEFEVSADGVARAPAWPNSDRPPAVPKQRFAAGPAVPWLIVGGVLAVLAITVALARARRRENPSTSDT